MDPARNPMTFLCETCGYVLQGLPAHANCPECGRGVAASLPAARGGTPWQRRAGLMSFLRTATATVRRPAVVFESVRLEFASGAWLMGLYLVIAAVIFLAPWSGVLLDDPLTAVRSGRLGELVAAALVSVPLRVAAIAAALLALTLVEWAGVQFFANRRGWRLTPLAAWQVCAHASVGWVLAAAFCCVSLVVWLNLSFFGLSGAITRLGGAADWIMLGVPAAGAFAGMMIFETLVYVGVQRCRYANRPVALVQSVPA